MSTPDRRDPLARPAPTRKAAYRGMPLIERLWQRLRAAISGERGLTALVLGVILLVGVLMRVWALGGHLVRPWQRRLPVCRGGPELGVGSPALR